MMYQGVNVEGLEAYTHPMYSLNVMGAIWNSV